MSAKREMSAFVKVKCNDCGNEQVIFGKASTTVKCPVCSSTLATPTGGQAKLNAKVVRKIK